MPDVQIACTSRQPTHQARQKRPRRAGNRKLAGRRFGTGAHGIAAVQEPRQKVRWGQPHLAADDLGKAGAAGLIQQKPARRTAHQTEKRGLA
jgi:hypothetical protein